MTKEEIIEQIENTIELIKQDGKDWLDDRDIPILEACIKSLTALDKIRAEIIDTGAYEQEVNGKTEFLKGIDYCLGVIDKYRTESEAQDADSD